MRKKPEPTTSLAAQEIKKAEEQFDAFDQEIKAMTLDRMNLAPKPEVEPQTKLSQNEIAKKPDVYLKPTKTIGSKEKFNDRFRAAYEYDKEYVHFIAENKEIIGETIDIWTKPYPGMPAEEWLVPCNKPVWGPRYLAEQIKRKFYHRLVMQQHVSSGADYAGQYYGSMAVDTTVPRLDAQPVNTRRSVFMGSLDYKAA